MSKPQVVLVTGASGFVGRAVLARLVADETVAPRAASRQQEPGRDSVRTPELAAGADWSTALEGAGAVVHLAARVHVMRDTATDPLAEFRRVNTEGTETLARQAARAGVRRFIYVSSIKANGEETKRGQPFTEESVPHPVDPYGVSKLEAEQAVARVAGETGMEFVVIRPPLVYGPGVRANFRSMISWVKRGIPLPLGALDNQRTLVAVDNLADLIATTLRHPGAANQIFLAGDGEDLSTTELLHRIGRALGRPARLVPVPRSVLFLGMAAVGRANLARRVVGSLQADTSKSRRMLSWRPPIDVDEGLRRTVAGYARDTR